MKQPQRMAAAVIVIGFGRLCFGQDVPASTVSTQLKTVKGIPFSAQVVTETTQTLVDGNRIVRKSTAFIARDGEGRTRRDQSIIGTPVSSGEPSGAAAVFIQDPVAGISLVLETRPHSALKIVASETKTAQSVDPIAGMAGGGGPAQVITEALGTQIIEGVEAQGTRITRTISANQAGNEQPIKVVSEIWYSSAMETVVMSRSIDPRLGETVFQLTNIQRAEPDPSLFQIPGGYTVLEPQNGQR